MTVLTRPAAPLAQMFADDGAIPNNPRLPFLVYRNAIDLSGTPDPETVIEKSFTRHGWVDCWRNGIYTYVHYHSMIHEALGIARGRAKVRFGGARGEVLDVTPGVDELRRKTRSRERTRRYRERQALGPLKPETPEQVEKLTGKKVRARYSRDPAILGGAIVRVGSTIYDGSVLGQLQRIREQIAG